jgi:hypothetical protein
MNPVSNLLTEGMAATGLNDPFSFTVKKGLVSAAAGSQKVYRGKMHYKCRG